MTRVASCRHPEHAARYPAAFVRVAGVRNATFIASGATFHVRRKDCHGVHFALSLPSATPMYGLQIKSAQRDAAVPGRQEHGRSDWQYRTGAHRRCGALRLAFSTETVERRDPPYLRYASAINSTLSRCVTCSSIAQDLGTSLVRCY